MLSQPLARRLRVILPAAMVLAGSISGCAGGGSSSYPSLARRPAERLPDAAQPVAVASPAAMPGAPSAELAARLQRLVEQARRADRDFAELRAGAEKQIAAGRAALIGSEDWARATQALSGLESARTLTAQPLSDLDRLEVDDRLAHAAKTGGGPDGQAVAQARDTVAGLVAEEDAVLAKLDGKGR